MELLIDNVDRRILYELDINARIPVTQLAKKLRLSREKVNYRINNLIKRGIIRKFVTMINPVKLGYSVFWWQIAGFLSVFGFLEFLSFRLYLIKRSKVLLVIFLTFVLLGTMMTWVKV